MPSENDAYVVQYNGDSWIANSGGLCGQLVDARVYDTLQAAHNAVEAFQLDLDLPCLGKILSFADTLVASVEPKSVVKMTDQSRFKCGACGAQGDDYLLYQVPDSQADALRYHGGFIVACPTCGAYGTMPSSVYRDQVIKPSSNQFHMSLDERTYEVLSEKTCWLYYRCGMVVYRGQNFDSSAFGSPVFMPYIFDSHDDGFVVANSEHRPNGGLPGQRKQPVDVLRVLSVGRSSHIAAFEKWFKKGE